jgi:hypothetical protein
MRTGCAREVCSDQKAHEIHRAAPAPQEPPANYKRERVGKQARGRPEKEIGLGRGDLSDFLSASRCAPMRVPKWEPASRFGKTQVFVR